MGDKVGDKVTSEKGSTISKVNEIISELCQYEEEREWFELKENWYKPDELGEYISALLR